MLDSSTADLPVIVPSKMQLEQGSPGFTQIRGVINWRTPPSKTLYQDPTPSPWIKVNGINEIPIIAEEIAWLRAIRAIIRGSRRKLGNSVGPLNVRFEVLPIP